MHTLKPFGKNYIDDRNPPPPRACVRACVCVCVLSVIIVGQKQFDVLRVADFAVGFDLV